MKKIKNQKSKGERQRAKGILQTAGLLSAFIRVHLSPILLISLITWVATAASAQVTYQHLLHPNAQDWLTYSGDYTGRRHSALKQIDASNVSRLSA